LWLINTTIFNHLTFNTLTKKKKNYKKKIILSREKKRNKTKKIFYDIKKHYSSFLFNSHIQQKFLFNSIAQNQNSIGTKNDKTYYSPLNLSSEGLIKLNKSLQVSERKLRQKEQKLNLELLTTNILSSNNLIKITLANPKKLDPHVLVGFVGKDLNNTFTYNNYNVTSFNNNKKYPIMIRMYLSESQLAVKIFQNKRY
jgi:hypothetical protein